MKEENVEIVTAEIVEPLVSNEVVIALKEVNQLPVLLFQLDVEEKIIDSLIKEKSGLLINGISDKKGAKSYDRSRLDIKEKRLELKKKLKTFDDEAKKILKCVSDKGGQIIDKCKSEESKKDNIYKKWEEDVKQHALDQEQKHKDKIKDRLKMIHALNIKSDGHLHTISIGDNVLSINNDEIEIFTDEAFFNIHEKMECLSSQIDERERIKEEERLAKEREEKVAREKLEEELKIERDKQVKELALELAKIEKQKAEIAADKEIVRLYHEEIKAKQDQIDKDKRDLAAKELADKKALEAIETAKQAKIISDKEAADKLKADKEREKRLAPSKSLFMEGLGEVEKLEDVLFRSGLDIDMEIMKITADFDNQITELKDIYTKRINNL